MPTQTHKGPFDSSTKMSDLICQNYDLLLVITRFGIHLGFGEKSVGEVCADSQIDSSTVLAVLNAVANMPERPSPADLDRIGVEEIIAFLSNSHNYFLDFRLPSIRRQLLSAISNCPSEVAYVIRRFFDEYVEEVHKHMSYEEKTVFPYARKLVEGRGDRHYNISIFSKRHDQIEAKIGELKNILIKYYPAQSGYELNSVLHDIFASEADLATHNFIEDHIFIPKIRAIEMAVQPMG